MGVAFKRGSIIVYTDTVKYIQLCLQSYTIEYYDDDAWREASVRCTAASRRARRESNGSAGSERQIRTMPLARGELEEMWRWLMETETDDGAGSLREMKERSQYSSTIHNARVKLRNG